MKKGLLFLLISILSINFSKATHWVAGNLEYECIGNDQYTISLITYWDCNFSSASPDFSAFVNFNSSCGNFNETLNKVVLDPTNGATEVDVTEFLCGPLSQCSECDINSPSPSCPVVLPGIKKVVYETTVTLASCSDWVISYDGCCRNDPNDPNISTSNHYDEDGWYVYANLDNSTAPCNSSPSFFADLRPYICEGQLNTLDFSSIDPDGDQLVYSLQFPLEDAGVPINIDASWPYDEENFIRTQSGIDFDSLTGIMTLTPDDSIPGQIQIAFFSVRVDEYRNGVLIGSIVRDVQLNTLEDCQPMEPFSYGIVNPSTDSSYINDSTIFVCAGDTLDFDVLIGDSIFGDSLTITTDMESIVPSSFFNMEILASGLPLSITSGHFHIEPTVDDVGEYTFNITVENNGCPVKISEIFSYTIVIFGITEADLLTDTTCIGQGDSIQIFADGGLSFQWSILDTVGLEIDSTLWMDCDTCANAKVYPPRTTQYIVTTDLGEYGCPNTDTVNVVKVGKPSSILNQDTCIGDSVMFEMYYGWPFFIDSTYKSSAEYIWSFEDDTISNDRFIFALDSGVYYFIVNDVVDNTDSVACSWIDSVSLTLFDCTPPPPPPPPPPPIPDTIVRVPNIFTPNGDGFNDVFEIDNIEDDIWNLTIYNRWGKTIVAEFLDYQNDWDGKGLSDGTYFYYLTSQRAAELIVFKGWFVIAR